MGEQESKRYGADRLRSQVPRRDRHSKESLLEKGSIERQLDSHPFHRSSRKQPLIQRGRLGLTSVPPPMDSCRPERFLPSSVIQAMLWMWIQNLDASALVSSSVVSVTERQGWFHSHTTLRSGEANRVGGCNSLF